MLGFGLLAATASSFIAAYYFNPEHSRSVVKGLAWMALSIGIIYALVVTTP